MNPDIPETNLLFKGRKVLVYHQLPTNSEPAVVIKVLKKAHPTPEEVTRFYNEYEIAQVKNEGHRLNDIEGIRKVYQKGTHEQHPAIYMDM